MKEGVPASQPSPLLLEHRESDSMRRRYKVPLEARAQSKGKEAELDALNKRAKALEKKLLAAYTSAPSRGEIEHATQMVQEELIQIAREARGFADQYRSFNVGAAILGFRSKKNMRDNPWAVLFDANTMPVKGGPKCCAEQYVMDRAEEGAEKVDQILSFTVVGEPQADDHSHVPQVTLTPCKLCRDRMHDLAEDGNERKRIDPSYTPLVTLDTEVITAHANQPAFRKYQHVKDLHRFHKEYVEMD